MLIPDNLKVTGHINIKLFDADGNLKDERDIKNVITTSGKNYLANYLIGMPPTETFMPYIGLGTDSTAASAANTTLFGPLPSRVQGTLTASTNVWQNQAIFGPGVNTGSIVEAGLFTNGSGGTMFARQTFGVVTKGANDTIQVTWQVTFS